MSDTLATSIQDSPVLQNVPPAEVKAAAEITAVAIANDPVLMNATGQERWWQSGVGVFGTGGLIWAFGVLFSQIGTNGADIKAYDFNTIVSALGSIAAFAGVLYRRYMPGLKPMFHSWFGTGK